MGNNIDLKGILNMLTEKGKLSGCKFLNSRSYKGNFTSGPPDICIHLDAAQELGTDVASLPA